MDSECDGPQCADSQTNLPRKPSETVLNEKKAKERKLDKDVQLRAVDHSQPGPGMVL